MLKIRDDVDLKELEKFGFVNISENLLQEQYRRGMTFIYHNCDKACKILGTTTEKINEIRKKNNQHLIFEGAIVESDGYYMRNMIEDRNFAIQDLIKAGIVEEV